MRDDALTQAQAEIFKALGHPSRLTIVKVLSGRPKCVLELAEFVDGSQPTISRHLDVLLNYGIVRRRRLGTKMMYELACPCVLQAIECATEALEHRLAQQVTILKKQ